MAYDIEPLTLLEEKQALVEAALAGDWALVFEHDPETAAAGIRRGEKGAELAEVLEL